MIVHKVTVNTPIHNMSDPSHELQGNFKEPIEDYDLEREPDVDGGVNDGDEEYLSF